MKLVFKIANADVEAERIYDFRESLKSDFELRKQSYFDIEIPQELKNKIIESTNLEEVKNELTNFINEITKTGEFTLKKEKLESINAKWKEVEKLCFNEVEKLTQRKFDYKIYKAYLIFSLCGHYKEGTNEIYIDRKWQPNVIAAICGEELLHLHYWKIINKLFKVERMEFCRRFDMRPWQISEVIPEYVLFSNAAFKKFGWSKFDRSRGYPWIPGVRKILDKLWKNKKDFKDFVIKAHKKMGCLPIKMAFD